MKPLSRRLPSVSSSSRPKVLLSSTVMTPSLPTLSIASAIISPMAVSPAEIEAVEAICSLVSTSFASLLSSSLTRSTADSMPRFRDIGLAPATTLRRPSRTSAWARTVAVVVPSPATSSVFFATSLTSSAPIFSYGSSSSISLAMLTPSLVMVGAPHFFSSTTLRPLGPRVTFTASARVFIPRSRPRRASSLNAISLGILRESSRVELSNGRSDARDGRPSPRRSRPAGSKGLIETVSGHTTGRERYHSRPMSANQVLALALCECKPGSGPRPPSAGSGCRQGSISTDPDGPRRSARALWLHDEQQRLLRQDPPSLPRQPHDLGRLRRPRRVLQRRPDPGPARRRRAQHLHQWRRSDRLRHRVDRDARGRRLQRRPADAGQVPAAHPQRRGRHRRAHLRRAQGHPQGQRHPRRLTRTTPARRRHHPNVPRGHSPRPRGTLVVLSCRGDRGDPGDGGPLVRRADGDGRCAVDTAASGRTASADLYRGPLTVFLDHGFHVVRRSSPAWILVRRHVDPAGGT